ncbi:hypothetical protein C2W62_38420 [Candidatus Entotheonella serta]|nr:hypothetical protein C2W62_38420 [Candidatus Entotheonella serta]
MPSHVQTILSNEPLSIERCTVAASIWPTTEFLLLSAFLNHPQVVLSRDQLLNLTRGREGDVFDGSIDNQD